MTKTIEYAPLFGDYVHIVVVDKIAHLSKDETGEVTRIHLTTGEVLLSNDSIKTLDARINHAG